MHARLKKRHLVIERASVSADAKILKYKLTPFSTVSAAEYQATSSTNVQVGAAASPAYLVISDIEREDDEQLQTTSTAHSFALQASPPANNSNTATNWKQRVVYSIRLLCTTET